MFRSRNHSNSCCVVLFCLFSIFRLFRATVYMGAPNIDDFSPSPHSVIDTKDFKCVCLSWLLGLVIFLFRVVFRMLSFLSLRVSACTHSVMLLCDCSELLLQTQLRLTTVSLYRDPKDLADYLIYLDQHDNLYQEYLQWKVDGMSQVQPSFRHRFVAFLVSCHTHTNNHLCLCVSLLVVFVDTEIPRSC